MKWLTQVSGAGVVLFVLAVFAFLAGYGAESSAETSIHQLYAVGWYVIAAVLLGSSAICSQIQYSIAKLTPTSDRPTPPQQQAQRPPQRPAPPRPARPRYRVKGIELDSSKDVTIYVDATSIKDAQSKAAEVGVAATDITEA